MGKYKDIVIYVKDGKLLASIPCPICGLRSRRLVTRRVPIYFCTADDCGGQTTLSASEVKRLGLK